VRSGIAHLLFASSNNHYTWRKVTTTVNNIIVGRLWVDNHGEMDIKNHTTGDNCHLKFFAYSYFSREVPRKVSRHSQFSDFVSELVRPEAIFYGAHLYFSADVY